MVTGKVSPKFVLALLENLPEDSSLITAMRGGTEHLGWNRHTYVAADLYDALQAFSWLYLSAHTKKRPKMPEPYPRPGVESKKEEKLPNSLLLALKGEDVPKEVGPGSAIPLPPRK